MSFLVKVTAQITAMFSAMRMIDQTGKYGSAMKFSMTPTMARIVATTRGPGRPREQGETGQEDHDPEDQVDPAPCGDVERVRVVPSQHEELVVQQGHEPVQRLQDPDRDHREARERQEPHGPRIPPL
jgi:hypothetical protein